MVRVALGERVVVGPLKLVPALAVFEVVGAELPLLLGILEPVLEPLPLFLLADVEEALHERQAACGEQFLDVLRQCFRFDLRAMAGNDVALAIDQEFCEIPFDTT